MVEQYVKFLLRWRWAVIILMLLMAFLFASGGRFIVFQNDYRIFFDGDNPQLNAFESMQDTYIKNDTAVIVLEPKGGNVFTRETLAAVEDITDRAWKTPFSSRVDSLSNYQHTEAEEDDLNVGDLYESAADLSEADLARIREITTNEPLLLHRLISPSGHVTAVNITVELPGKNNATELPQVIKHVRDIENHIKATYPDINVYLTGIIMMDNAFPEATQYDMKNLIPLAFALILLIVFLLLRNVTSTVATLIVIALSIMSGMGLAGWLGINLSPPAMSAPTIILTLAVADCVHLLSNWVQGMRKGLDKNAAIVESMRINFMPILLTSVTTAIGFMSLNFSDAPPFRDLGNISALGVMMAFVFSVTLLPALISILPTRLKKGESKTTQVMDRIADFVIEKQKILLISIGIFALFLVAMIARNELNDVFVEYFDESIQFRTDSDFVVDNLTGLYFVDYSLDSKESGGLSNPEFLQNVENFSNWLREQPEVIHVNTITDIFKRLNRNLHGDDDTWYKLPGERELAAQYLLLYEMSLPYGLDLNNQIDIRKQSTRLTATMKTISTREILAFEERVDAWMTANTPKMHTHGASPTIMFAHIGKKNIESMLIGTTVALVLISLILIVALKSWRYGLISLVPNLLPAGMAFGVWALVDGEIGLALSVVTAMTLGIVVDDTIHFLSKYLRAKREQGLDATGAVRYAFHTVGMPLWVTSAALMAGFLVIGQSAFELNASMGMLVSIVIGLALFCDFFFLPPLLIWIERVLNRINGKHTQAA